MTFIVRALRWDQTGRCLELSNGDRFKVKVSQSISLRDHKFKPAELSCPGTRSFDLDEAVRRAALLNEAANLARAVESVGAWQPLDADAVRAWTTVNKLPQVWIEDGRIFVDAVG